MFNQRQIEIVLELCENADNYMTASYFADKHQVSLRTVQNDIKLIKKELSTETALTFQSLAPKGSRITVNDPLDFTELKERLYQQFSNTAMNYQSERINQLIVLLLNQHRSISLYDIETSIYVSHNTLLNDLKRAEEVLQKYHRELMRSSNKVMVDGTEINKRLCRSEENLLVANSGALTHTAGYDDKTRIKNILVETFVTFKHNISEVSLNNAILMVDISIQRMKNWFYIEPSDFRMDENCEFEQEISACIFKNIREKFHIQIPDAEIDYFAIYLKGQGNYTSTSVISQEMNDFILNALRDIRATFNIDLTDDLNLRISLALHCTSLIVRIQYDMQLKNHLVDYIRQTYPQGFDIAAYFASLLQEYSGKKVNDEEIAFIAIHLYKAIMELQSNTGTKKILVISSLRRSENILLRQTLYSWFPDQIAELYFVFPEKMDESYLERYDTFITTEKGRYYDMGLAIYISQFPDQQDYLNLKLAMDGFKNISDILEIFHQDQFVYFDKPGIAKQQIIDTLCQNASSAYNLKGLNEAVMERENMRSTFFGNGIAAPHPMSAVSSNTFVCVGISRDAVEWDVSHNKVHLILLVGIGKNNTKAFQLWNYLSKLFADRNLVKKLLMNPCYENFLKLLKYAISDNTMHE